MIGTFRNLNPQDREAVVIGAGISGLLIAYALDKSGYRVTLIEESGKAGGLIASTHNEYGLVESAAHSFLVTEEVRELCDDLGVELCSVRPESRARFIYRGGKMRRFPLTIWEVLVAFFKAYFVLSREETSRDRADLEQWGCRHLGKAAVDYLLSPFLTGIYAAKPSEICVGAAFPALEIPAGHSLISAQLRKFRAQRSTQKKLKSSARKERKAMMVPRQGMGALVFALEKRLEQRLGERFRKNEKVLSIPDAANVILATPAAQASALLASIDPVLSKALSKIRYVPLICATLFVPKEAFSSSPAGVGVLVPESEKRGCLGVLFNSSAFPGRVIDESQWISLSMMLGGTVYPEVLDRSDEELLTLIRGELRALFGLSESAAQSSRIFIRRWPRAIPMYNSDVMEAWEAARAGWCASPGRVLAGNYTGQVSIRGMIQDAYALGSELPAELNTPRSI